MIFTIRNNCIMSFPWSWTQSSATIANKPNHYWDKTIHYCEQQIRTFENWQWNYTIEMQNINVTKCRCIKLCNAKVCGIKFWTLSIKVRMGEHIFFHPLFFTTFPFHPLTNLMKRRVHCHLIKVYGNRLSEAKVSFK